MSAKMQVRPLRYGLEFIPGSKNFVGKDERSIAWRVARGQSRYHTADGNYSIWRDKTSGQWWCVMRPHATRSYPTMAALSASSGIEDVSFARRKDAVEALEQLYASMA